jgi:hypothetical protein
VALSKSEMEVEQLRRDLQVQLRNKKELMARVGPPPRPRGMEGGWGRPGATLPGTWKVTQGKTMEEMARKLKKYEKLSHQDVDRLLQDLNKRSQEPSRQPEGTQEPPIKADEGLTPFSL